MNAHEWYSLASPLDHLRAWLWVLANFGTFIAYFMIPFELFYWRARLSALITNTISGLFIAFIAACGLSHIAMIFVMPTAPWWVILLVYLPLAVISLITAFVLRAFRPVIIHVLTGVQIALNFDKDHTIQNQRIVDA